MEWFIGLCVLMAAIATFGVWLHQQQQGKRRTALLRSKQAAARSTEALAPLAAHFTPAPISKPPAGHGFKTPNHTSPVIAKAAPKFRVQKLTWVGAGHPVSMAGLTIENPVAYFFDSRCGLRSEESAAIDFGLPVAPTATPPTERELPYWPKYTELTPAQRRIYLEWIAGDRQSIPPELGYTFLFIYGLERRTLVEGQDHKLVFDELLRLRELYAGAKLASRSFDNYTLSLLCFLIVLAPQAIALKRIRRLVDAAGVWSEDNLAALLAWFALINTPLPNWVSFVVAKGLPQSQRSVVINRVGGEFQRLFCKRYAEQFGDGIKLQVSKRPRKYNYRPASAAFPPMTVSAANPLGISSQFKVLSQLWNQGIVELRKLSSAVAKSEGEMTVAAWESLPIELKAGTDHPLASRLCDLVNSHMSDAGRSIIAASTLSSALEIPGGDRITPAQGRKLCSRAADVGYNLEPDAHLTGKGYKGEDPVAVFLKMSEDTIEVGRYNAAACMLRIGLAISAADGGLSEEQGLAVAQHVRSAFELTEDEQRRLDALRGLIADRETDLSGLGKLSKSLTPPQREMIGKLAVALVAEDGVVTSGELRALRKCSTALGLEKQQLETALRALTSTTSSGAAEPVTVVAAGPMLPGERIPPPPKAIQPKSDGALHLDKTAIASIMRDTQEVARMLAAAMGADNETGETAPASSAGENLKPASKPAAPLVPDISHDLPTVDRDVLLAASGPAIVSATHSSLPARYAAFYQILLSKEGAWTMKEAEAAARQEGHMLSGALEALNEWAYERLGGQLFVEDGDQLILERELLN